MGSFRGLRLIIAASCRKSLRETILQRPASPRPTRPPDLAEIADLTRAHYYRELDRASRSSQGIYGFLAYALRGFVDGLDEQLDVIREHQWQVAWAHFVHEQFRTARGATDRRRRTLALALSSLTDAVALDELPSLGVDVARAYASLSRRTLIRDVQALVQRGLLRDDGNTVRVNRGLVQALLPWRYEEDAQRA